MIELAGVQRTKISQITGERLKEAVSNNKALSALSNVFHALEKGKTTYMPFRESKLTFLLQGPLCGVRCNSPELASCVANLQKSSILTSSRHHEHNFGNPPLQQHKSHWQPRR